MLYGLNSSGQKICLKIIYVLFSIDPILIYLLPESIPLYLELFFKFFVKTYLGTLIFSSILLSEMANHFLYGIYMCTYLIQQNNLQRPLMLVKPDFERLTASYLPTSTDLF